MPASTVLASAAVPVPVYAQPAAPPKAGSSISPAFLAHVKQRVESACAGGATGVEVIPQSGTDLTVRLKARSKAEAQVLARRVMQIPELGPYRVTLEVHVGS
jgi:hypothetical protein